MCRRQSSNWKRKAVDQLRLGIGRLPRIHRQCFPKVSSQSPLCFQLSRQSKSPSFSPERQRKSGLSLITFPLPFLVLNSGFSTFSPCKPVPGHWLLCTLRPNRATAGKDLAPILRQINQLRELAVWCVAEDSTSGIQLFPQVPDLEGRGGV